MLKLPSIILKEASATSRREFASIIFRSLQRQTSAEESSVLKKSAFAKCFVDANWADAYYEHIGHRIHLSIVPFDKTMEDCIILPPLFPQSSENALCQLTPQLFLILCASGPIVPVVRISSTHSIMGDTSLLTNLFRLYEALSEQFVTSDNVQQIFDNL